MRTNNLILSLGFSAALALTWGGVQSALSAAAAPPPAAFDKTFTHEGGGIQFDLPDGLKSEEDGDMLTVSTPDEALSVVLWLTEADAFEAAAEAPGEELAKKIKGLKMDGEPKEGKHNGMEHASVSGSGQADGRKVAFSADLVMAKKPVIILSFASPEMFEKHESSYVKLVKSIRKVR